MSTNSLESESSEKEKELCALEQEKNNNSIKLEWLDSGIALITVDMPNSKVNTLGSKSMFELSETLDKVAANDKAKGLIISSGKENSFIAGADVKEIQQIQKKSIEDAFEASQMGKAIFAKIEKLPFNTLAAINGICLGGGTELALACKFRIASENAKVGLPEVQLGFVPGWGACVRLPRLVGLSNAIELIMTGKILSVKKALRIGLIEEVCPESDLLKRSVEIVKTGMTKASAKPIDNELKKLFLESNAFGIKLIRHIAYKTMMSQTKGKYPAPKKALDLIVKGFQNDKNKAMELESIAFAQLAMTDISSNLVSIFFAQQESKKIPINLANDNKINTVGVLGAGIMGAGIAQAAARAGFKVILKDVKEEYLEKGKLTCKKLFDTLVEKGKLAENKANKLFSEMKFVLDYESLAECDLVIEAVLEDMAIKKSVLVELEKNISKRFVFASNTSSLSISELAESAREPGSVVGVHFFNPVHKMPLVEIIKTNSTSEEALALAMKFAMTLDKTTVLCKDSPGFIVNRILAPYMREAAILAEEGISVEDIDRAMKSYGMPMGPMALLDEVGLDIAAKVIQVMENALGNRFSAPELLKFIESKKLLGKKAKAGIYLYDENNKILEVNPVIQTAIKAKVRKSSKQEIQDRLLLLMLNEAARCLSESVVSEPTQLDLAMIFGTGFPPFEGGILRWADKQGIKVIVDKMSMLAKVKGLRYEPAPLLIQMCELNQNFYI